MSVSRFEITSKVLLEDGKEYGDIGTYDHMQGTCLLYTSDAADDTP